MNASLKIFFLIILKIFFVVSLSQYNISPQKEVNRHVKVHFSPSPEVTYQYRLSDFHKIYQNPNFIRSHQTAIYIHGLFNDEEMDRSVKALRIAYQKRNDTNFISINWQFFSRCFDFNNAMIPQLKIICETIAENLQKFLDLGYDVKKVHLVGFSLGGQCIGLVSRHLKNISNHQIPKLYALDPAGPGFEADNPLNKILTWLKPSYPEFVSISREDAKYVQIIHTNGGKFGMLRSQGHADFFPNNGSRQAGCTRNLRNPLDDICSRNRAWVYFQESVYTHKPFEAVKCDSYDQFKRGKCKGNLRAPMGLTNNRANGNFYLVTSSNIMSTSLGEDGLDFRNSKLLSNQFGSSQDVPEWEESEIEYETLFIVEENGVLEERNVKFHSSFDDDEIEDLKEVDETNGSKKLQLKIFMSFISFPLIFL